MTGTTHACGRVQGALLCEIASHLAGVSDRFKPCARAFAAVAAAWAGHFQHELTAVRSNAAHLGGEFSSRERELQAKCAFAHLLAVLCHRHLQASSAGIWAGTDATLSQEDAAALCLHRVQADLHAFNDGSGELHVHVRVLAAQCQHTMAALIRAVDAAAAQHGSVLCDAVRSVYADLPPEARWRPVGERLGCYTAEAGGQVYSVNVLSGAALCNGMRPGHLPRAMLRSKLYRRVFHERTFEVSHLQMGQHDVFRTTQSHGGCIYSFEQRGKQLIVTECPVHAETGRMETELELQLLPGEPHTLDRCLRSSCTHAVDVRGAPCFTSASSGIEPLQRGPQMCLR